MVYVCFFKTAVCSTKVQVVPQVWVYVTAGWAAGCSPFVSGPPINNLSGPVISVALTLFSLPLTYLLALSMKTADAKGIKELINKENKRETGRRALSFYQTGVIDLWYKSRNSGTAVGLTFTALRPWNTWANFFRILNGNTDSSITSICSVSDIHFWSSYIFIQIEYYVRNQQWPASQINFNCLFGEFILAPCSPFLVSLHGVDLLYSVYFCMYYTVPSCFLL